MTRLIFLSLISFVYFLRVDAQSPEIKANFISGKLAIDGKEESAWQNTESALIKIAMNADLSEAAPSCQTNGNFKVLWDGAKLYLLIRVKDSDLASNSEKPNEKDAIEIFFDLFNDKYAKYEDDDAILKISCDGQENFQGTIRARFEKSATAPWEDGAGNKIGYIIESAINIGGVAQTNGTRLGLEIAINDVVSSSRKLQNRIFWSNGANNGIHNNTLWGTVILAGYDGKSKKALDNFMLKSNVEFVENMPRGIWESEKTLDKSFASANKVLSSSAQKKIDKNNLELENAIKHLRRKGPYVDPMDLPAIITLPDPFTFQNGMKLKYEAEWTSRANEIKSLAQYYEYGTMPEKPQMLTATLDTQKMQIVIEDRGRKTAFEAQLVFPEEGQSERTTKFPVIVSIDFFNGQVNPIYLNAGYAVLSLRYVNVASDNYDHKGSYYDLYPYDIQSGKDAGTLLAWAWGASRCVDALEYLAKNVDGFAEKVDLTKLVVTGFSRCGKAALAAGLFDDRFGVVSPGASGAGGAAVYRYVAFGNNLYSKAQSGHEYVWGTAYGSEVMGDKIRHQGHNSNQMLQRFLNWPRIYKSTTFGYGERLPYDHHEIIAAIAPRAVLINAANDDYSNNAEGDAIGFEGAKKVYDFLGIEDKIGLNLRTTGEPHPRFPGAGGHWLSDGQITNLVAFADFIFYDKPLSETTKQAIYSNPYLPTFDKYFGGLQTMMPWSLTKPR